MTEDDFKNPAIYNKNRNLDNLMEMMRLHKIKPQKVMQVHGGAEYCEANKCCCAHQKRYHENEIGACKFCGCKEWRERLIDKKAQAERKRQHRVMLSKEREARIRELHFNKLKEKKQDDQ